MERRHEGRVAVVTGAATGIGQAHAERLAKEGADIVIADLAPAEETVELVERAGSRAIAVRCDLASGEQVAAMAHEAVGSFGKVDVLIHNAGIYPQQHFSDITFDDWRKVMSVNVDSAYHLCHELLPGMRERGWGRVVFMCSTVFHMGPPGMSHYTASKAALIGFLRSLAPEVGNDGVTVNGIAPGVVNTENAVRAMSTVPGYFESLAEQQAIQRTAQPDDLVGTMSFLVSEDAAFLTGQTICVDGGWVRA
jgi:NAD(P)-dependent dehydrogenase (short-subunit alcohol dehydrogenase family)